MAPGGIVNGVDWIRTGIERKRRELIACADDLRVCSGDVLGGVTTGGDVWSRSVGICIWWCLMIRWVEHESEREMWFRLSIVNLGISLIKFDGVVELEWDRLEDDGQRANW